MTSPLARLERTLARLVEGAFDRLLRPQLQPVHLARRLDAAMEEGAMAGVRGPIAPNAYVITLAPSDYARFEGAAAGLQRDLERHLAETAARRRLRCLGPFVVEFQADPALAVGRFDVRAAYLSRSAARARSDDALSAGLPAADVEHTIFMPAPPVMDVAPAATLDVLGPDGAPARVVAISGDQLEIGRAESNGLVLPETAVSRRHAVVRRDGTGYVVEDLGSTNGVFLNGKLVQRSPLKDGDRLQIGTTALVFRLRAAPVR